MAKPRLVPVPPHLGALTLTHAPCGGLGRRGGSLLGPSCPRPIADAYRTAATIPRRPSSVLRRSSATGLGARSTPPRGCSQVWCHQGNAPITAKLRFNICWHGDRVLSKAGLDKPRVVVVTVPEPLVVWGPARALRLSEDFSPECRACADALRRWLPHRGRLSLGLSSRDREYLAQRCAVCQRAQERWRDGV